MSDLQTWVKGNGTEVEINSSEDNIKAARAAGWKKKGEKEPKKAEKK